MKKVVNITFPNEEPIEVSVDVVSLWEPEDLNIIGDTIFFTSGGGTVSMNTNDYFEIFNRVMRRKTLVLKEGTKYQEFVIRPDELYEYSSWSTCATPELYPMTATMELIKGYFPDHDFIDVTLETVEIKIIKE